MLFKFQSTFVRAFDKKLYYFKYQSQYPPTNPECKGRGLIIGPSNGMGLCNQIRLSAHAIAIAIQTDRVVFNLAYMLYVDAAGFVPIHYIFDLDRINQNLQKIGVTKSPILFDGSLNRTEIYRVVDSVVCLRFTGKTGMVGNRRCHVLSGRTVDPESPRDRVPDVLAVLNKKPMVDYEFIAMSPGVPFHSNFKHDPQILHQIYQQWELAPIFTKTAQRVLKSYNITYVNSRITSSSALTSTSKKGDFIVLHLRLEDDFLRHLHYHSYLERVGLESDQSLEEFSYALLSEFYRFLCPFLSSSSKVFLATGLGKHTTGQTPIMDFVIDQFKHTFQNNLIYIEKYDSFLSEVEKEIDILYLTRKASSPLFDLAVATEGRLCIGINASSFSDFLSHRCQETQTFVPNIKNIVSKYPNTTAYETRKEVTRIDFIDSCLKNTAAI